MKLVCGVGINDSNYPIQTYETIGYTESGKNLKKRVWICPFYSRWKDMLTRCYSKNYQEKFPTYAGCYTVSEWHYFMTFKAWMEEQDWEGKELDKDILFPRNRVYSPNTCVFVDYKVNTFLTESQNRRGEWPIGVSFHKIVKKFESRCSCITTGKIKFLGYYATASEAHQAWLHFKLDQAYIIAAEQTDARVAKALIERYENYGNW